MAVTAVDSERDDSLRITSECAQAEKPSPPYCLGIIIAKNLLAFRKAQTSGERSCNSQLTCQSSTMWQSCSTGPARKAASSSESAAAGNARSFAQSGFPVNRSASHQTSPASIASRSVFDRLGSARFATRKSGLVIKSRRNEKSLIEGSASLWVSNRRCWEHS